MHGCILPQYFSSNMAYIPRACGARLRQQVVWAHARSTCAHTTCCLLCAASPRGWFCTNHNTYVLWNLQLTRCVHVVRYIEEERRTKANAWVQHRHVLIDFRRLYASLESRASCSGQSG